MRPRTRATVASRCGSRTGNEPCASRASCRVCSGQKRGPVVPEGRGLVDAPGRRVVAAKGKYPHICFRAPARAFQRVRQNRWFRPRTCTSGRLHSRKREQLRQLLRPPVNGNSLLWSIESRHQVERGGRRPPCTSAILPGSRCALRSVHRLLRAPDLRTVALLAFSKGVG